MWGGGGVGWCFFFNDTATTEIYTLSLHDALPISVGWWGECTHQLVLCEEQTGPDGVADRVVVPMKSGNADGGKDPWSENSVGRGERRGDWR